MVRADQYRVVVAGGKGGQVFGCVRMDDFLSRLAQRVQRNDTSMQARGGCRRAVVAGARRAAEPAGTLPQSAASLGRTCSALTRTPGAPLALLQIFERLYSPPPEVPPSAPGAPLATKVRWACSGLL